MVRVGYYIHMEAFGDMNFPIDVQRIDKTFKVLNNM